MSTPPIVDSFSSSTSTIEACASNTDDTDSFPAFDNSTMNKNLNLTIDDPFLISNHQSFDTSFTGSIVIEDPDDDTINDTLSVFEQAGHDVNRSVINADVSQFWVEQHIYKDGNESLSSVNTLDATIRLALPKSELSSMFQYNWTASCLNVQKGMNIEQRRPMMSIVTQCCTKKEYQDLLGDTITNREWAQARKHAKFPGAGFPNIPKPRINRKNFDDEAVSTFLEWLHGNDFLQSLSFGQKVVQYYNGVHTAIEAVKLTSSTGQIIKRYSSLFVPDQSDDIEMREDLLARNCLDVGDEGCLTVCRKSKIQCLKAKGHKDRHAFTPKGCLSRSSITRLLSQLTSGKIKSLAGLDDTDTKCGMMNFASMRSMVETFVGIGQLDRCGYDKEILLLNIDRAETFHKVGFARHLGQGKLKVDYKICYYKHLLFLRIT